MAEKDRKLKLADIRRLTPNPVEGLTGFDPDKEGNAIADTANLVIVNKVLKDGNDALKHIDADPNSSYARQRLLDATDLSNWSCGTGDWDPNKPEEPKKKRRR